MEIVSISPQNVPVYGFSFFLLINLVGAMLGYWINKKLSEESLRRELFDFLFRSGIWSFLVCYAIIWLDWFALGLITQYEEFVITSNIWFFCQYFFWVPATIATAIYGVYKWSKSRKQYSDIARVRPNRSQFDKIKCQCGHVNLVPVTEVFYVYENIRCEKCGRIIAEPCGARHVAY